MTGYTADSKDFNDTLKSHAPLVFVFVLTAAFLLLLFTFRSIVIPFKAIVLNLLSVGAAYGVLVWIFQDGHLESAPRLRVDRARSRPGCRCSCSWSCSGSRWTTTCSSSPGSARPSTAGCRRDEAVAHGIKTTAGVVTSAAVVMIAVFAIFATLSLLIFKQLGVGLAVAVLIDATIIRGVLLPATMKLLGDWNWYLPNWLEWLPHVTHEPELEPLEPGEAEADRREPESGACGGRSLGGMKQLLGRQQDLVRAQLLPRRLAAAHEASGLDCTPHDSDLAEIAGHSVATARYTHPLRRSDDAVRKCRRLNLRGPILVPSARQIPLTEPKHLWLPKPKVAGSRPVVRFRRR